MLMRDPGAGGLGAGRRSRWQERWAGLLTRSAARPHAVIVCTFANDWPPAGCTPVRAMEITTVPAPSRGMTT